MYAMESFVRRRSISVLLFLGVGFGLTLILGNRSPLATAGPAPATVAQAVPYDWLQMNGDAQHSGNNTQETILGLSNVGSLQFLFQVLLPFPADGTPVGLTSVVTSTGTRDSTSYSAIRASRPFTPLTQQQPFELRVRDLRLVHRPAHKTTKEPRATAPGTDFVWLRRLREWLTPTKN